MEKQFRDYVVDECEGYMLVAVHNITGNPVAWHIIHPEGAIDIRYNKVDAEQKFNDLVDGY